MLRWIFFFFFYILQKTDQQIVLIARAVVPMFKHEVAQLLGLSIPALTVQIDNICVEDLT